MILNLYCTITKAENNFYFPDICLDETQEWQLYVQNCSVTLNAALINPIIVELSTNIIRRSDGNSRQILNAFAMPEGTTAYNYTPTIVAPYLTRFHNLESSFIKLDVEQTESTFKPKSAFIQLEITQSIHGGI